MKFICDECKDEFKHQPSLSRHQQSCGGDNCKYCCSKCGKQFKRKDSMMRHQIKCSPKERKFDCETYGKSFRKNWLKLCHIKNVHQKPEKTCSCKTCNATFKQRGQLVVHKKSHSSKRVINDPQVQFNNSLQLMLSSLSNVPHVSGISEIHVDSNSSNSCSSDDYSYDEECTSMVYGDQQVPPCSYNNQQVSVTGLEGRFL